MTKAELEYSVLQQWDNQEYLDEPETLYEKQKEIRDSLKPCPKCGNKVEADFCVWDCCRARFMHIECPNCSIYSEGNVTLWNNREIEIFDIETGEICL